MVLSGAGALARAGPLVRLYGPENACPQDPSPRWRDPPWIFLQPTAYPGRHTHTEVPLMNQPAPQVGQAFLPVHRILVSRTILASCLFPAALLAAPVRVARMGD